MTSRMSVVGFFQVILETTEALTLCTSTSSSLKIKGYASEKKVNIMRARCGLKEFVTRDYCSASLVMLNSGPRNGILYASHTHERYL